MTPAAFWPIYDEALSANGFTTTPPRAWAGTSTPTPTPDPVTDGTRIHFLIVCAVVALVALIAFAVLALCIGRSWR